MAMSVVTKLTDEEFLALPDEPGKQELLDGELITLPPPAVDHNDIGMRLFELLRTVFPSSRVRHLDGYKLRSGRWLTPDISVIWPDQPRGKWFEGSPMLAIEVASPANTDEEIDRKVQAYLEDGAAEVGIVRPATSSMTVFKHGDPASVRYTGVHRYEPASLEVNIQELIHGV